MTDPAAARMIPAAIAYAGHLSKSADAATALGFGTHSTRLMQRTDSSYRSFRVTDRIPFPPMAIA